MTIVPRTLTFNFRRAVNIVNGQQVPETMEVSITPMASPSAPDSDITIVGGVVEQKVLLNNSTNVASFSLIPSNSPGLTEPIPYLAAFRQGGVTGVTTTQLFAMPDANTAWDDLPDLGSVIPGIAYLQQADLNVTIATLDDDGRVQDATGHPVAMPSDLATVSSSLAAEVTARIGGDVAVTEAFQSYTDGKATATLTSANSYTDDGLLPLSEAITAEVGARQNAVSGLATTLSGDVSGLQGQIDTLGTTVGGHTSTLATKADKDGGGHVPIAQIPPAAITNWVSVANTAAMTALTYPTQVQPGDIAYTPTAVYGLLTTDPSSLSNWRNLTPVTQVNGHTGSFNLTAADVGAVDATSGTVTMAHVTGLTTALGLLASTASLNTLQTQVNGIQNDTTTVHTVSGLITDALMPVDVAFIDVDNNLVTKTGDIIPLGAGSGVASVNTKTGDVTLTAADVGAIAVGGTITEGQVTGLSSDLSSRVLTSDSRLTNARTPTAHATSHASAGSDPITISQSQVTGLSTALTGKASQTDMTTAQGQISTIQTALTGKADLSGPGTTVPLSQLPTIPGSTQVSGWGTKADLVSGTVPLSQTSQVIPQSYIVSLISALAGKADLTGPGSTVNPAQLPSGALTHVFPITSQAAMLALSGAKQGDVAIITTGVNLGTYILAASDPSILGNWDQLLFPSDVISVNTHTGAVTLTAADVGAIATTATNIGQNQITNLVSDLAAKASTSSISTLLNATQVQAILAGATPGKQVVNYVATANIASLSGRQTADSVLMALGSTVLLTAQTSSVDNGLYTVNTGAWSRTTDMASAAYFLRGSLVIINQGSQASTLWQETAASGVVGTAANNWLLIGSMAIPNVYTAGNGLNLVGSQFSGKVVSGGGVQVGAGGFSLDSAVAAKKVPGTVPSTGSTTVTLHHGLNNLAPSVVIVDVASGNIVDLGVRVVDADNVSAEFASAPASNQYRFEITG